MAEFYLLTGYLEDTFIPFWSSCSAVTGGVAAGLGVASLKALHCCGDFANQCGAVGTSLI